MLDVRQFIESLKRKDTKRAREWLEINKVNLSSGSEFEEGYLLALQGMISALESSNELSAITKLLDKKYEPKQVAQLVREAKARISQKFRPDDERGFDAAWVDVLRTLSGERT